MKNPEKNLKNSTSSNRPKSQKKSSSSKKPNNIIIESSLKSKTINNPTKNKEIYMQKFSKDINPTRITDFFVNSSNIYSNDLSESKKEKKDEEIEKLKKQIENLQKKEKILLSKMENQEKELLSKMENLEKEKELIEFRTQSLEEKNLLRENLYEKFKKKARKVLPDLVSELESLNLKKEFAILISKKNQFGYLKNSNARTYEDWIDGYVITDLKTEKNYLHNLIEKLEKRRKKLKYNKKATTQEKLELKKKIDEKTKSLEEINQKLENCKKEKLYIVHSDKKFELSLDCLFSKKTKNLEKWPIIKNYKILSFLGRGGFAEVYKAFDLQNLHYVAIKIHHINEKWNSSTKESYIKKTSRENKVFSTLDHPNIVKYYDSFSIDENTFCTILEYCEGNDLSYKLKAKTKFSEKPAKKIIKKILGVLLYLNNRKPRIIHYDLKPGNILFTKAGDLKITDFGLCKMNDSDLSKIQLTSPGCGTFDYLPPECFSQKSGDGLISDKVDVWSLGVIFFQLVFGRKPFGHFGKSRGEGVGLGFGEKCGVSQWSREFLEKCLRRSVSRRIGVSEAWKIFEKV